MSKNKKPRSKDPHSWIKDTTKQAVEPGTAEQPGSPAADDETTAGSEEEAAASDPTSQRFVIVEYDGKDGSILALHEIHPDAQEGTGETPSSVSEGKTAAKIALAGKLLDKTLLDLHENHKVVISKTKATLVPKG